MRRLKLTLGYRGTRYAGWAAQSPALTRGRPTLQHTLEGALEKSVGHPVRVVAAGRTDAGVHADAQVVAFDTSSTMPAVGLQRVVHRWLPDDLWVTDVAEVLSSFDPRRAALRRWYRYAIWRQGLPFSAWQGRSLVDDEPLDLTAMRQGAASLLGRRDFAALATDTTPGLWTVRTVFAADWRQVSQSLLIFEICADAFLKQMVRAIVGSLLWVGSGRWTAERFTAAIGSGDRRAAGPNAPAVGLSLHRIEY
ncbi:MAG TPA: tRNA pseudouridine(38-40) synthase TruA [Chloroflexota bacterium]|nr:tRNA pseudouridine(38-40) synthase TruA [Chloroflexota bacterium]